MSPGKAGGSSVNCVLRAVRSWTSVHCDNSMDVEVDSAPESAISRHVNCYTHWDSGLKCFYLQGDKRGDGKRPTPGNDYLVNLRSPLDRIASWFTYEHTENHDAGTCLCSSNFVHQYCQICLLVDPLPCTQSPYVPERNIACFISVCKPQLPLWSDGTQLVLPPF